MGPKHFNESDDAMYVSSLVVARFAAGEGLGAELLKGCEEAVRNRGKKLLKLDCWDGNEFLKRYYRREGFRSLEAVREKGYFVGCFEKHVGRCIREDSVDQKPCRLTFDGQE